MQIADGRKTVEQVRAGKNETSKIAHAKERAARSSLIIGLETEIEELKAENAKLREQLDAAQKVAA